MSGPSVPDLGRAMLVTRATGPPRLQSEMDDCNRGISPGPAWAVTEGSEVYGLVSRQRRDQAAPHINMTPDLSMGTTL